MLTILTIIGLFALVVLLMRLAPREDTRRRADDAPLTDRGNWS
jgi:hypothetical protein